MTYSTFPVGAIIFRHGWSTISNTSFTFQKITVISSFHSWFFISIAKLLTHVICNLIC